MDDAQLFARERAAMGLERGMRLRPKSFRVVHRPYAGLRSVIYDRGDHFEVRLSELMLEAPEAARASLARILIGNLDRRLRSSHQERLPYVEWARSPAVNRRHEQLRGERGRKRMAPARGQTYDLEPLFDRLNAEYFAGRLTKPRLGWTLRPSRSLYGHQDSAHNAIVLNRRLDHPRVPETVVCDILHHEMVHLDLGVRPGRGSRRIVHGRAFREAERRYRHHEEAQRWLRQLESGRVRLRFAAPTQPRMAPVQGTLTDFLGSVGSWWARSR